MFKTIVLLFLSNVFMTYAWYGHLKDLKTKPIYIAIFFSWCVAFFEYCLQVPANRIGANYFNLPQLKIIQEIISLLVFALFASYYFGVRLTMNYFWAAICILGAVYFVFRDFKSMG